MSGDESKLHKAVDYTKQLISGIFTTTLQVNYNQILMLVFMKPNNSLKL